MKEQINLLYKSYCRTRSYSYVANASIRSYRLRSLARLALPIFLSIFSNESIAQDFVRPEQYILDEHGVDILSGQIILNPTLISVGATDGTKSKDISETRGAIGPSGAVAQNGITVNGYIGHNWNLGLEIRPAAAFAGLSNNSEAFVRTVNSTGNGQYTTGPFYSYRGTASTLEPLSVGYLYTSADGLKIYYDYPYNSTGEIAGTYFRATKVVYPNGVIIRQNFKKETLCGNGAPSCAPEYQIDYVSLRSVTHSLGYQVNFSYYNDNLIGINQAYDYCDPENYECTNITYPSSSSFSFSWDPNIGSLINQTDQMGRITSTVNSGGENGTLKIIRPGQSNPTMSAEIYTYPYGVELNPDLVYPNDSFVYKITDSNGVWLYNYTLLDVVNPYKVKILVKVDNPQGGQKKYLVDVNGPFRTLLFFTDENGQATSFTYDTSNRLERSTLPEGNSVGYTYDGRGNVATVTAYPKPGTGSAIVVKQYTYPAICANSITCNLPLTVADANNNVTTMTYDQVHGGLLTQTGPSVNGIQPVIRKSYVQRYAWTKNSAGGYTRSTDGAWLVAEERTCASSATVGNTCAAGAADETVTAYDYGPDSGPNNLRLRGVAVTAGGVTLRSCMTYDPYGNVLSKTTPRAGLSVCS